MSIPSHVLRHPLAPATRGFSHQQPFSSAGSAHGIGPPPGFDGSYFPVTNQAIRAAVKAAGAEIRSRVQEHQGLLSVTEVEKIVDQSMTSSTGDIFHAASMDKVRQRPSTRTNAYNPSAQRGPPSAMSVNNARFSAASGTRHRPPGFGTTTGDSQYGTGVSSGVMFHQPTLARYHEASFCSKDDPSNPLGRDFYTFADKDTTIVHYPEDGTSVPEGSILQIQSGTDQVLEVLEDTRRANPSQRSLPPPPPPPPPHSVSSRPSRLPPPPPPPLHPASNQTSYARPSASRFSVEETFVNDERAWLVKDPSRPHESSRCFLGPHRDSLPEQFRGHGVTADLVHGQDYGVNEDAFFTMLRAPDGRTELWPAQEVAAAASIVPAPPTSRSHGATNRGLVQSTAGTQETGFPHGMHPPPPPGAISIASRPYPPPPPPPGSNQSSCAPSSRPFESNFAIKRANINGKPGWSVPDTGHPGSERLFLMPDREFWPDPFSSNPRSEVGLVHGSECDREEDAYFCRYSTPGNFGSKIHPATEFPGVASIVQAPPTSRIKRPANGGFASSTAEIHTNAYPHGIPSPPSIPSTSRPTGRRPVGGSSAVSSSRAPQSSQVPSRGPRRVKFSDGFDAHGLPTAPPSAGSMSQFNQSFGDMTIADGSDYNY
ncbi:hypothetical protein IAT40_001182 [Kwoniella sp. CBS 6097]